MDSHQKLCSNHKIWSNLSQNPKVISTWHSTKLLFPKPFIAVSRDEFVEIISYGFWQKNEDVEELPTAFHGFEKF